MTEPLHNDTREYLMNHGHTAAALILDCMYYHNYKAQDTFTSKDAHALIPCSDYLLRDGLSDDRVFKSEQRFNGKKGRPAVIYTVPDRDTLRDQFVPVSERGFKFADVLPTWAYRSKKEYRLAYMQNIILRRQELYIQKNKDWDGFSCPTDFWTDRLGVCASTVRKYKRILLVKSTEQYDIERVTEKTVNQIPQEGARWREFLVMGKYEDIANGKGKRAPLMRHVAERWLAQMEEGMALWRVRQLASLIKIPMEGVLYWGNGQYSYDWNKLVIVPNFAHAEAA